MSLTLAVDITGECGSIALADTQGIREEVLLLEPRAFSEVLFGEIRALLHRQNVAVKEIGLFAGAAGPGSFTGVRIGLAAIKGLAEVLRQPVVTVSNLEAVATYGTGPLRAALIDARRGEFYAALFDAAGNPVIPESVISLDRFLSLMPEEEVEWVSSDPDAFAAQLEGTRFASMPRKRAPRGLAGAIARIAIGRLAAGLAVDPAVVEANYVRRSDAEVFWKQF